MKFLTIEENDKSRAKVYLIRFAVLLSYLAGVFYTADAQYAVMSGIVEGSVLMYAMTIIVTTLISWLVYWLFSNVVYNIISRSKYFPVNESGTCAMNRPTFQAYLGLVTIIANLIRGGFNLMLFNNSITIAFGLLVLPRIISIFAVGLLFTMIYFAYGRKKFANTFTAMTIPMIILIFVLAF